MSVPEGILYATQWGVRYIVTSKKWRDRGKGRGFGYVTSKLVRYRCGEVQSPESYSNPGEG